jgi:hypothetical protein
LQVNVAGSQNGVAVGQSAKVLHATHAKRTGSQIGVGVGGDVDVVVAPTQLAAPRHPTHTPTVG